MDASPTVPDPPSLATLLVHGSKDGIRDAYSPSSFPIYQTATFSAPDPTQAPAYDYTRSGNPTRTAVEELLASMEGARRALAFATGMAALTAVIRLLRAGDRVIAGVDIYGGTSRLLGSLGDLGIDVIHVDTTDVESVERALRSGGEGASSTEPVPSSAASRTGLPLSSRPRQTLLLLESPTNPRLQICDLGALCALARAHGALSCVDVSVMTAAAQNALDLGADVSMTSATKFLGGHSDIMAGVLAVRDPGLAARLAWVQNAEGAGLGPWESWLLMRGVRTLALRLCAQTANAAALASWLESHPAVTRVLYPGLEAHPGRELHARQASGAGSLLSFCTGDAQLSRRVCMALGLFKCTVSFGGVASLVSMPAFMSHASIPAHVRAQRGLPDDLVRVSAGIENDRDLIADLDQAFERALRAP
ncbi:Cys/Met metabolism PLP-dependent enzyme [Helicosporidium sp. ATCC 50920]|nr:Cys/Met metabolism PLP-dependent enzyme [Helicosporidium sp. ATCC 50920]|eukprot:KDD77165.1 Cys/Met metabolism PLP-dependent enzyme [Helicosporidium sp. ATCC 50920]